MISIEMIAILIVAGLVCSSVLRSGNNIVTAPVIFAATALAFLVPQYAWIMQSVEYRASVTLFTCLVIASILAVVAGWRLGLAGIKSGSSKPVFPPLRTDLLLAVGAFYLILGIYGRLMLERLDPEQVSAGIWSGEPVFYGFLYNFLFFSLAITWPTYLVSRRVEFLALATPAIILVLENAIFGGRREKAALIFCMLATPLIIARCWRLSRLLVIGCLAGGALAVSAIGAYREAVRAHAFFVKEERAAAADILHALTNMDWLSAIVEPRPPQQLEISNALAIIEGLRTIEELSFGLGWYNILVHNFVPGQIVGHELKSSLMSGRGDPRSVMIGHEPWPGSTYTGVADGFFNVGYGVPIVYGLIAYFLGYLYRRAIGGSVKALAVYPLLAVKIGNAFSHSIGNFLVELVLVGVLVSLPLAMAETERKEANSVKRRVGRLRYTSEVRR